MSRQGDRVKIGAHFEKMENQPQLQTQRNPLVQINSSNKEASQRHNLVLIKNYVDMSDKYGIGYLFSNGCFGAFFNDKSKISELQHEKEFQYMSKQLSPDTGTMEYVTSNYNYQDLPPSMQKKATILRGMKSKLKVVIPDYSKFYSNT